METKQLNDIKNTLHQLIKEGAIVKGEAKIEEGVLRVYVQPFSCVEEITINISNLLD